MPITPVRHPHAVLVSMPWTTLTEPSLGLGILKAVLARRGISARVKHLNLGLLRFLQAKTYYALANVFALNDFLFSGAIEPAISTHQRRMLSEATATLLDFGIIDADEWSGVDGVVEQLLDLRQSVIPAWLDEEADAIVAEGATFVGFSCMFDQTIASVALAQRIKQRAPDVLVALGGYAARPPTAQTLLTAFDWVDAICVGEGEPVICGLAQASVGQQPLSEVPNLVIRDGQGAAYETPELPFIDINTSPDPDYDDFFADLAELEEHHSVRIGIERLPLENSRGCWWGQKSHCVFCGIADSDMVYRAKQPDSVIGSLQDMSQRYGITAFRFSDYILPQTYYKTLLPELAKRDLGFRLTGEIKANIKPEWMAALADAGFAEVQPGIESLSDRVLASMRKGITAVRNIQTLLLGKAAGVLVHHNLIYGFPDDDLEDYRKMAALLPRLFHLDPPSTRLPVQITRFAPLQEFPERFGIERADYCPDYDIIFSAEYREAHGFDNEAFCYYFERPFENAPALNAVYRQIDVTVDRWKALQRERDVVLSWERRGDGLHIRDTRGTEPREYQLGDIASNLLIELRTPQTMTQLAESLSQYDEATMATAFAELEELGLIFKGEKQAISLVLPTETSWRQAVPAPAWPALEEASGAFAS